MSFTALLIMARNLRTNLRTQSLRELKQEYEKLDYNITPCFKRLYLLEINYRNRYLGQH